MVLAISLVIFFLCIIFLKQKVVLDIHIKYDEKLNRIVNINKMKSTMKLLLFGLLTVYKKDILNNKKKSKNKDKDDKKKTLLSKANKKRLIKGIINKCYVKEFGLLLSFNLQDAILNSAVNAAINSLICVAINLKQKQFNLKKLYYQTDIGSELFVLHLNSIITLSVADTIKVIIKEYIKVTKEKNKIASYERSSKYGRTSN